MLHFNEYIRKIDYLLSGNFCDKFFFATDELELRSYVKYRYGEQVILYDLEGYENAIDREYEKGLHFTKGTSAFLNAKNAIIEAYLLASCHFLVSSHKSSMSLFVTFINPDIVHIILEP